MRRRIAVFANGWGSECLLEVGHGLRQIAAMSDIDLFAFVNYVAFSNNDSVKKGEISIFTLPNLEDFDGVVVLTNSFNTDIEFDYVRDEIHRTKIPAVSIEVPMEETLFFGVDDYSGMQELTEHLISEHGIKDILYIGGLEGHEGEILRRKAVKETAEANGILIPEENFLYGDFAAAKAIDELKEWRKYHVLPEVIICANDIMAVGICDYLKDERYRIPEDVKVTGFDCLKVAREYEPSITSVNKDWVLLGTRCMEKLIDKIEGKNVSETESIGTSLVTGGTCGCIMDEDTIKNWKSLRRKVRDAGINGFTVDQHFRHMYIAMRKVVNANDMSESLTNYFCNEGWVEGKRVMLSLVPDFFSFDTGENQKEISMGYPEQMDVASFAYDGMNLGHYRMNTRDIIFEASNKSLVPNTYVFVPLHGENEMHGFAMMSRGFSVVQSDILYIWTKHMGQYLEQVKSNIAIDHLTKKLETLSITDGLTGAYNRAGCENVIYSELRECQKKGGRSVLLLADVDCLKKINDTYGHNCGDEAITSAVRLLKKYLPEDYLIGRFGGDEFLIGAPVTEELDASAFAEDIMNKINTDPMLNSLKFRFSISIGGIQLAENEGFNIKDCMNRLDRFVYDIKEIHHKNMDCLK